MENDKERKNNGYHKLLNTWQSVTSPQSVSKAHWHECRQCKHLTPVKRDFLQEPDGTLTDAGTRTDVCAHCGHCHVGTAEWTDDEKNQKYCHNCNTPLSNEYQCPKCAFPRGWKTVQCPYCSHFQPVHFPHWVVHCDMFHLECVKCEKAYDSLCIC